MLQENWQCWLILTDWDEIELLDVNMFWIAFLNDMFLAVFWIVSSAAGHQMLPMGLVILTGCNGGLQIHCHRPKLLLHEQERQHKKGFKQSTGQLQTFE